MKHTVKLIKKEEVANGTMAFHLEKPEGFTYKAGQNADFTIVNPPETDEEGNTRPFSFASSPEESDLYFATRMRDTAFKRTLKNCEELTIEFDGPMGDFTLHQKEERPAIFLIGGIGITPIYSIIKDATSRNLPHKLYLFYSNRTQKDAAFLADLKILKDRNSNFTFVPTFTDEEVTEAEKGYINADMIKQHATIDNAVFYLSGPSAMVTAMRKTLSEMGVIDDDIKTEEFSGY